MTTENDTTARYSQYDPVKVNLLKVMSKSILLGMSIAFNILALYQQLFHQYYKLNIYFLFLTTFHIFEFVNTVSFNTTEVDDDSFILEDNDMHAITFLSIMEHILHIWCYNYFSSVLSVLGLILALSGQIIRSISMYTAQESFNHYIQRDHKVENHVLVTHGVYKYIRHPSYFGFFWWFIGLQLYLNNIAVFIGGGYILWKFFKVRIEFEEGFLVKFFGQEYIKYKRHTRTFMMI
ncbi:Protein-S-isoprenylcysteine O-methyltransferase [Spathaspora sp. JA1]|nr:Protein-S-isoprenylcysteine O-methyltransferase [Spathaspora sp. JA1]